MLPVEVLKVILGALSRHDLDVLMLTNALFRDIVLRDFVREPVRYFAALNICYDILNICYDHQSYELVLPTGNEHVTCDNDDFTRCMRLARVGKLDFFHPVLDQYKFELLLPVRDAWRDGHVYTPPWFSSQSLFDRAFSELLFCKSMLVSIRDDQTRPESQPFLTLPAVRECTSLDICMLPLPLTAVEIVEWLSVDARSMEPKRLAVGNDDLDDSVEDLVHQLKKDFIKSAKACQYVATVYGRPYDEQSGRLVNKNTSEVLIISHGTDDDGRLYVKVERKLMDETR